MCLWMRPHSCLTALGCYVLPTHVQVCGVDATDLFVNRRERCVFMITPVAGGWSVGVWAIGEKLAKRVHFNDLHFG